MKLYTKIVDGVKKIFYSETDSIKPTDAEVTYRDNDGDIIAPVAKDTYVNAGKGVVVRKSDGKKVFVCKPGTSEVVVPEHGTIESKTVKSIRVVDTTPEYVVGSSFAGTVYKVFADGDEAVLDSASYTVTPASFATAGNKVEVKVEYAGVKPVTLKVKVVEAA